jgi:hypothetical protein
MGPMLLFSLELKFVKILNKITDFARIANIPFLACTTQATSNSLLLGHNRNYICVLRILESRYSQSLGSDCYILNLYFDGNITCLIVKTKHGEVLQQF